MPDTGEPQWEEWMDNPLLVDQPEGVEVVNPATWQMQLKQPNGSWAPLNNARNDRDEVTRIQAYYLSKEPDPPVRILKRVVTWTVDEVPGDGEGQTPAAEILTRNEAITQRVLTKGTEHQPAE